MKKSTTSMGVLFISFLILAFVGLADGGDALAADRKIDKALARKIESRISSMYKWEPDEYKLEYRAEWNHARLPMIVAIPTKRKIDWSPTFVILPDKTLLSPRDKEAFSTVLKTVFTEIKDSDAPILAELSIIFGVYGRPVGAYRTHSLEGRGFKLPRKAMNPVLKRSGGEVSISFYSFDYELMVAYDCGLVIKKNGAFSAKAVRLKK